MKPKPSLVPLSQSDNPYCYAIDWSRPSREVLLLTELCRRVKKIGRKRK